MNVAICGLPLGRSFEEVLKNWEGGGERERERVSVRVCACVCVYMTGITYRACCRLLGISSAAGTSRRSRSVNAPRAKM